jgi:ABC-type lipoprotein release transport system permease subunit
VIAFKLAYRNLAGAGMRTWLNVVVLSLTFVVIVLIQGVMEGWNRQAKRDSIDWQYGGGQIWHEAYDPYDPLTLADSRSTPPGELVDRLGADGFTPILMAQGSIYPNGRMRGAILRGIEPNQGILQIPSALLAAEGLPRPVVIGTTMAASTGLVEGDELTVRWQDSYGAYDATEVRVAGIFDSDVPAIDAGQVWLPMAALREMLQVPADEATLLVVRPGLAPVDADGWVAKTTDELLADLDALIKQKSLGSSVLYVVLLAMALLAIFDTQVLAVFRRRREIGTQVALGMTRWQVVGLFTLEGTMYGVLAVLLAAVLGGPFLLWLAKVGYAMPEGYADYGIAVASRIFPVYSAALLGGTVLLVLAAATIVSFIPARKIARMSPTDAIRGKVR